jgi:hypothetical protein
LLPLPGPEQTTANRLAARAVARADKSIEPWADATKALTDFRQGRFADALVALEKAESGLHPAWHFDCLVGCVRAMTLSRLGRRDEAQAALEKASGLYRSNAPHSVATIALDPWIFWYDVLICEILLREAEAVVLYDHLFPANPFAP